MQKRRFTLGLVLTLALGSVFPQPTLDSDVSIESIVYALCFNEAAGVWTRTARFAGNVTIDFDASVDPLTRDAVVELLTRINPLLEPTAHLSRVATGPNDPSITVYVGTQGRLAARRVGHEIPLSGVAGFNYSFYTAATGRLTQACVWIAAPPTSAYTRAILAQELTQVLGPCADPELGSLWRDTPHSEWLDSREQLTLRLLYAVLEGNETRDTTRRIVASTLAMLSLLVAP